jgi:hypothetical protein
MRLTRTLAFLVVTLTALVARADTLDDAVRRYVSSSASAAGCRRLSPVSGENRWECRDTECPGACQVVEHVVVLGERNGTWRRVSERREHMGDTGACGCCLGDVF